MIRTLGLGLVAGLLAVGCYQPGRDLGLLENPEPSIRALAASRLGSRGVRQAVPALIERLSDEDPFVRSCAVQSLREMTRQDFAYEPSVPADRRRDATRKWAEWWERQQPTERPSTRPR